MLAELLSPGIPEFHDPQGMPALREKISVRLRDRGMEVEADHIIITNGSQQALDLVTRALATQVIGTEDPSYQIRPIAPVETLTPGATPPPAAAQEATGSSDGPTATAPVSMADRPAKYPPEAAAPTLAPPRTTVAEAAPSSPPKVLEAPSPVASQPEASSPLAAEAAAPQPRPTAIPDADEPMEPVL